MFLSGRAARIIPMVSMVGIAALTLIGAGSAGGPQTPAYVRINVSEKNTVYLEFQGGDLRAAMNVEGLKTAQPVKMLNVNGPEDNYPKITLPIPADQLPAGITAVKATCAFPRSGTVSSVRMEGLAYVHIAMCPPDENKTQWEYDLDPGSPSGSSPESAPAIQLPNLEKLELSVAPKAAGGALGIVLQLEAAKVALSGVKKDGQSVEAVLRVFDASGKEVASKKGSFSDFGFS